MQTGVKTIDGKPYTQESATHWNGDYQLHLKKLLAQQVMSDSPQLRYQIAKCLGRISYYKNIINQFS